MKHPFENACPIRLRNYYWLAFVATFVLAIVLQSMAADFTGQVGPDGQSYDVIAFEFAKTPDQMREIVSVWGEEGVAAARTQVIVDYLFLLAYSNLIALGIFAVMASAAMPGWVASLGRFLAWGQWLAALLDAIENSALLVVLSGNPESPWPQIAFYCAAVKFLFVIAGTLYILFFLPLHFGQGHHGERKA